MWDLISIVIPKVKASWKILAYSMGYGINDVRGWERNNKNCDDQCCDLFENWLSTGYGRTPKTWQTLLERIKAVQELSTAAKDIEDELNAKQQ